MGAYKWECFMASPYKWPEIHGFHWGWKFHPGISGVITGDFGPTVDGNFSRGVGTGGL